MKIESMAMTNVGRVRRNNEDNFFVCGKYKESPETNDLEYHYCATADEQLFGVCDGMGGIQLGELASLIAVETMAEYASGFDGKVDACIQDANARICGEITKRGVSRIGTTFAALSVKDCIARAYNIGDSRIYLHRSGVLTQLSVDHTQAQMLLDQGIITPEQVLTHRDRHVLTQHLGIFPEEMVVEPHCAEPVELAEGDIFLLCSDGLTDMLSDDEICAVLSGETTLEVKAHALINAALANGGKDNVTVVLVGTAETEPDYEGIESKIRANLNIENSKAKESLIAELMKKMREKLGR